MRRVVRNSIIAGVVLTAAAVGGVLWWAGHDDPAVRNTRTSSESSAAPGDEAHEVAVALGRLATEPESLVASSVREQVAGRVPEAIPVDSKVEVDEGSWSPDGAGGGVIAVAITSPGRGTTDYAAIMLLEGAEWKVVATVPMPDEVPLGTPTR